MKSRIELMTLLLGIVVGSTGVHFLTPSRASAQMMPVPNESQCSAMHSAMMSKMHSPADHAMMVSMMSMHDSMLHTNMTGNADHDFLTMMIPHHQAAVQMAKAELQYGKDPKVRALAQQIISAQDKEIAQMSSWLK